VRKLRDTFGLTIVMITHDLDLLWQVADRVAVLGAGKVQGIGSMSELSQIDHPAIRMFFAGPRGRAAQAQARQQTAPAAGRKREATIETKVNYPLVGAFVLVLGAVLVAGALWLASGGASRKAHDLYLAIVDESVAGLNLNAPVKYNGVDVGKVRQIQLDPGNPEQVNLLFAIERGTPIREDTVAVLKTQGLTGIAYVELSGGTRDAPPLLARAGSDYPLIRTKPSLGARVENLLGTVLSKLDSLSNNVNAILSDANRTAFAGALADFATVAHTIAARKDALDAGITHAARTFENTSRATAQLGPVVERVGRSADAVARMGSEVARTSASAAQDGRCGRRRRAALRHRDATGTRRSARRTHGPVGVAAAPVRADRTQSGKPPVRTPTGAGRSRRILINRSRTAMTSSLPRSTRPPVRLRSVVDPARRLQRPAVDGRGTAGVLRARQRAHRR
jgi:phospholipid/cholesterol/gamma-HCH transport system substrate-binding protein